MNNHGLAIIRGRIGGDTERGVKNVGDFDSH